MDNTANSPTELKNKLSTSPQFAAGFVVDNNYEGLKDKLASMGIIVDTPKDAYDALLTLGSLPDKSILMQALAIPYRGTQRNYTGGFNDFFLTKAAPSTGNQAKAVNWGGLLTVVGSVIGSVGSVLGGDGSTLTAEEQAAIELKAAEEAKAKRKRNWIIAGSIVGAIILVVAIAYFVKKNKKK